MKKLLYVTIAFLFLQIVNAQTINFTYDNGGNLIKRDIQIIPISNSRFANPKDSDQIKQIDFKIYPNPTNDFLSIEGQLEDGSKTAGVFLRNSNGMLVKKDNYEGQLKKIPVSDLASGIYFLEIRYEKKKSSNYKIVITN